jgi:hypothetical protein
VAASVRVVAMAGTILLVPLAHVENIMHIVVVASAVVDGWGLALRCLLF